MYLLFLCYLWFLSLIDWLCSVFLYICAVYRQLVLVFSRITTSTFPKVQNKTCLCLTVVNLVSAHHFNPNSIGERGGQIVHATQNLEKCPCLHYNNIALIKQISLFDTALALAWQYIKFHFKIKKNYFWTILYGKIDTWLKWLTPIWLGLRDKDNYLQNNAN